MIVGIWLLHNLSYPYNHEAVNGNIPEEFTKLTYSSISSAVDFIWSMPVCYLGKVDLKAAFIYSPGHVLVTTMVYSVYG